jgi:hypothetical protein
MAGPTRAMQEAAAAPPKAQELDPAASPDQQQPQPQQLEHPEQQHHQQRDVPLSPEAQEASERRIALGVYLLILVAFFSVQFGHGTNIGVAVSLPVDEGESKATNLALGSFVMVGVCLGLPITPWASRTFGAFRLCAVCVVLDFAAILLMLVPDISLHQIYFARFLVGFFEAPLLPYLQEWLARHGKSTWNVWNTMLHAMVPVGENLGFLVAQALVDAGFSWQLAFAGQAALFAATLIGCWLYGGRKYLDVSTNRSEVYEHDADATNGAEESPEDMSEAGGAADGVNQQTEVEYPATEKWAVYWATNVSLAAQLGFLSGTKYLIRDYIQGRSFSETTGTSVSIYSAIALIGPAIGGSLAMSGSVVRPDRWTQHRKTLAFLACTTMVASVLAVALPLAPEFLFWPNLFACFVAAGGVYPAAQGIINIALTSSRVIEASVYQVQCNNILFAMPLPWLIGKAVDEFDIGKSFLLVILLQVVAAAGFCFAISFVVCTEGSGIGDEPEEEEDEPPDEEERNSLARLLPHGSRQRVSPQDANGVQMQELLGRNGRAEGLQTRVR